MSLGFQEGFRLTGLGLAAALLLLPSSARSQSNCCVEHPEAGCDTPACEALLPGYQGVLCQAVGPWDAECTWLAREYCNSLCDPPITYQGELRDAGGLVDDSCDFEFRIFDADSGGSQVGATQSRQIGVVGGRFTTSLYFGAVGVEEVFGGEARFLETAVACPVGGGLMPLPRQPLYPSAYALTALSVAPGGVDTEALQYGSVTSEKIFPGSVTSEKIAANAVWSSQLGDGAVTNPKLAPNAVTPDKIPDGSLPLSELAPFTIDTDHLADSAVTGAKILDHGISLADLPGDSFCPTGSWMRKYFDSLGGWTCEPLSTLAEQLNYVDPPRPASLFGKFGGYGESGDVVISAPQLFSGVHAVTNLTIEVGGTAVVDGGFLFVGARERCTIHGAIAAGGAVPGAPQTVATGSAPGQSGRRASPVEAGYGMVGSLAALPVDLAVSGAGGGGGGANAGGGAATFALGRGGDGGGAVGAGGRGGCTASQCPLNGSNGGDPTADAKKRSRLTGVPFLGQPGRSDAFATLLLFPGGSGGGGGVGAAGGSGGGGGEGGGVVYLECNELEFTGSIDASGLSGGPGSGDAGGGGGGGGGVVLIRYRIPIGSLTGTIDVSGGAGSPGSGTGVGGGAGEAGFAGLANFP